MKHPHRNLHALSNLELSAVEIIDPGTVPMTDDQYTSAVKTLAVLINQWRADQVNDGMYDTDRPWAA